MKDQQIFVTTLNGVRVPRIIYGTAWKKERTAALVAMAIESGFRGIDTACQPKHYNEPGVGVGIQQGIHAGVERGSIYVQTKFTPLDGQDPNRIPYDPKATLTQQVRQSFEVSLRNLQTNYLDCLVLHSPLRSLDRTDEVWRAMEELVLGGGVRQLGISNCYDIEELQRLYQNAKVKPSVVQNRFYADTGYDTGIRAFCRDNGLLYQAFWTLTANPHILHDDVVGKLAASYQRTSEQIFYRYLTLIDIIPLIGTTCESHMIEDLSIFDFELTKNECAVIGRLLK